MEKEVMARIFTTFINLFRYSTKSPPPNGAPQDLKEVFMLAAKLPCKYTFGNAFPNDGVIFQDMYHRYQILQIAAHPQNYVIWYSSKI